MLSEEKRISVARPAGARGGHHEHIALAQDLVVHIHADDGMGAQGRCGAGIRNLVGGRSAGYEEELMQARNQALEELQQRAAALGASAAPWRWPTPCSACQCRATA